MLDEKIKRKIFIGKHKCKYLKSNNNIVIEEYKDLDTGLNEWQFVNCIEYNAFQITRCPFCSKKLKKSQILSINVENLLEKTVKNT